MDPKEEQNEKAEKRPLDADTVYLVAANTILDDILARDRAWLDKELAERTEGKEAR